MSDSDVVTAPAVQEEPPVQKAQEPGFGELKEQIRGALATYKKRGESIAALEQALSQSTIRSKPR